MKLALDRDNHNTTPSSWLLRALVLFLFVVPTVLAPKPAQAAEIKIVWEELVRKSSHRVRVDQRYHAKLYKSTKNFSAFLANPFSGTKLFGKAIVFDPDTKFALFHRIRESGTSGGILALSDNGYWIYVRESALQNIAPTSGEFRLAIKAFDQAIRYLPLKNSNKYANGTQNGQLGCNAQTSITQSGSSELEASIEWGIASATYGKQDGEKTTLTFEKGKVVTRREFALEGTGQFIRINSERFCGSHPQTGQHFYDVYINNQLLGSIRPKNYVNKEYGIDAQSGRARITCRRHRDSYFQYLKDELEIPPAWLQIVASISARWANGFADFENCN